MTERKYMPTLADLIDRLSIVQLKEVFIPEHKEAYKKEIEDIVHDLDAILEELDYKNVKVFGKDYGPEYSPKNHITGETIRAIVVLAQMNLHIWHNEANYRKGIDNGNDLELTHGLNGVRNTAKNKIQEIAGGRKDYKIDCLAAKFTQWEISWPDAS